MLKIKKWYVNFLEKDRYNPVEYLFCLILNVVSMLYGTIIALRNLAYERGIKKPFVAKRKVISIGNLSWAGSGKTTLAILLSEKLSAGFKTAVLRRGYGKDEEQLLKEKGIQVFSSPDRSSLANKYSSEFDIFILDDGFQHRKLHRDVNIVIMGAREFKKPVRLIPAYFFREPLNSLKRADLLILNYKSELKDPLKTKQILSERFPNVKIYFSDYEFDGFYNLNNAPVPVDYFKDKKAAALAAIGYPQGFFNKLKGLDIIVEREIIYPDHYELNKEEFTKLQEDLLKDGIKDLVITRKDKYHLPLEAVKMNIVVFDIGMKLENEEDFLNQITGLIS